MAALIYVIPCVPKKCKSDANRASTKNDSPGAELDRGAESDVSDVCVHMQTHATDLLLYLGH